MTTNSISPVKLFSIHQLGVATFLAVPAGLALMAVNYRRTGKTLQSNVTLLLVPVITVLLVVVGLALPVGTPTLLISLSIALVVKKIATKEFGEEIAAFETNGGRVESRWIVAGAVIAGLIVAFGIVTLFDVS